eukprot:SAG11_NODE_17698_length_511_cov_1.002427_1_plen_25_part_10
MSQSFIVDGMDDEAASSRNQITTTN